MKQGLIAGQHFVVHHEVREFELEIAFFLLAFFHSSQMIIEQFAFSNQQTPVRFCLCGAEFGLLFAFNFTVSCLCSSH
jgi:hypothetical protein